MDIYQRLAELEKEGKAAALCTIIESHGSTPRHTGSKMIVFQDGRIEGSVGGGDVENRTIQEALQAIRENKSRQVHHNMVDPERGDPGICGGQVDVYIEPLNLKPKIVIIGGGHVGKTLAHLGKWLGYRVAISDDRPEFCSPEANPDADEFYPVEMKDLPSHLTIDSQTYLILATRGVSVDTPGLPALIETDAAYIGVIGSRRRWLATIKGLKEMGIPQEKINRVISPIGLELQAETPEEIAVSIFAEILMLMNGASGKRMSLQVEKND
jgi:xanthine dehydrogenase accessory factor